MKTKHLAGLMIGIFLISIISTSIVSAHTSKKITNNIEKIDLVHYSKPENVKAIKEQRCYKFLGSNKLGSTADYIINPYDSQFEVFTVNAISSATETWDSATSKELFNDAYIIDYTAAPGIQDNKNVIGFDSIPQKNVIAITSIWIDKKTRQIIEFDITFNSDITWGNADYSYIMDLQNIATHELGHAIGLADLYGAKCTEQTMYGYSQTGETKKRTLESGDIAGLIKLYDA